MATKEQNMQEQEDFANAFTDDVQRTEMSEDEAFGLEPEAVDNPDDAEVVEEPEEPEVAEEPEADDPQDPAAAETGEAGPVEETAVVVEPGATDAGDIEVMSPEDIQREKSWMGRLKAKEAELKAREEALKNASIATDTAENSSEEAAENAPTEAIEDAMDKVDSGELTFDQAMKTLEDDFGPDFGRMLSVITKRIGSEVADERANAVRGEIDNVVSELRSEKERSHFESIADAHPDFIEVASSPEFKAYVDSLPDSDAAKQVIEAGSAKQINKLLSNYKDSTKVNEAQEPVAETVAEPIDESAVDAAEGVRSAGLKIPEKPMQADDYEAAWAEFS